MSCSTARAVVLVGALMLPRAVLAEEAEEAPTPAEPEPALAPWQAALGPPPPGAGADAASRTRGLALGVSAGVARSPGERERVFGLLELRVGLDEWVGARLDAPDEPEEWSSPPAVAAAALPDSGAASEMWPRASRQVAAPAQAGPRVASNGTQRAAPPARGFQSAWRSGPELAAARLARAVVAEALRVQGGSAELRRLDQMASRSRAAASLPEVRLGAGTARDESQRLSPTVSDPARFTHDGGRDLWLEARLTWRLDSAIFARDEIAIMRLRAQQRQESERLVREALDALVEWQRARLVQNSPLALPEEHDAASVRQFGAVARLDVLTDGWFSRYLERWDDSAGAAPGP
jgi:hypothetical protein